MVFAHHMFAGQILPAQRGIANELLNSFAYALFMCKVLMYRLAQPRQGPICVITTHAVPIWTREDGFHYRALRSLISVYMLLCALVNRTIAILGAV